MLHLFMPLFLITSMQASLTMLNVTPEHEGGIFAMEMEVDEEALSAESPLIRHYTKEIVFSLPINISLNRSLTELTIDNKTEQENNNGCMLLEEVDTRALKNLLKEHKLSFENIIKSLSSASRETFFKLWGRYISLKPIDMRLEQEIDLKNFLSFKSLYVLTLSSDFTQLKLNYKNSLVNKKAVMFLSENITRSLQEIFLQYKSILLVDLITAITKNREHKKFKDLFKEAGYGLYLSNGRF